MNIHELSDPDADALTITTVRDQTWITCTSGGQEVTIGPVPTESITSALPGDLMDGGVTAALFEQEAEKPTATDFAKARFARHPKGGIAMTYSHSGRERWINVQGGELSDAQMAEKGWVPVRECPGPDQHVLARDYPAMPDRATQWQERAEKAEDMAALWKETARRKSREARTYRTDAKIEEGRANGLARAITALRNRMFAAEQARDEAREDSASRAILIKAQQDSIDIIRAAQPRPLTPDDITDEMVRRALDANGQPRASIDGARGRTLRHILTAALTEPPTRPEGAEELDGHVEASLRGVGLNPFSAEEIRIVADNLADSGVRAEGSVR